MPFNNADDVDVGDDHDGHGSDDRTGEDGGDVCGHEHERGRELMVMVMAMVMAAAVVMKMTTTRWKRMRYA